MDSWVEFGKIDGCVLGKWNDKVCFMEYNLRRKARKVEIWNVCPT